MKRAYQITGSVFVVFSAFTAHEAIGYKLFTPVGPGPGFFPLWVSLFLGLLGLIMVYQATFQETDPMPGDFFASREGYMRMGAIILALLGMVVLMDPLGFRLTMLAFLLVLLFALGRQPLIVTAALALLGSFATYYAFTQWLEIPLPVGILGI